MPKLRNSEFKRLLALGIAKGQQYKMSDGKHRLCRIMEDDEHQAAVADFVPRELAALIIYMLHHAQDLVEIVDAFQDVTDGVGAEMLEACTGLPIARCTEITKTFAQLID
jgi:hypothetical protein